MHVVWLTIIRDGYYENDINDVIAIVAGKSLF